MNLVCFPRYHSKVDTSCATTIIKLTYYSKLIHLAQSQKHWYTLRDHSKVDTACDYSKVDTYCAITVKLTYVAWLCDIIWHSNTKDKLCLVFRVVCITPTSYICTPVLSLTSVRNSWPVLNGRRQPRSVNFGYARLMHKQIELSHIRWNWNSMCWNR